MRGGGGGGGGGYIVSRVILITLYTAPQKGGKWGGQFESFKIRFFYVNKRRVPKKKACIICLNVT